MVAGPLSLVVRRQGGRSAWMALPRATSVLRVDHHSQIGRGGMRLLQIDDVPPPVGHSLYQGMVFNHGQARTHAKLSYHAETIFDGDAVVRVLNLTTEEWLCATIEFLGAVQVSVDEWDDD